MSELRVVVDTGVAISAALLRGSVPRQAVDLALSQGRLLVSADSIAELDDVFRRPKFNKYLSEELRLEFLAALIHQADLIEVSLAVTDCRDSKDNKFLELAASGSATHILTSDNDLLVRPVSRGSYRHAPSLCGYRIAHRKVIEIIAAAVRANPRRKNPLLDPRFPAI